MKVILHWFLALVFAGMSIYLFVTGQSVELELAKFKARAKGEAAAVAGGDNMVQINANELNRLRQESEEVHRLRGEISQLEKMQQTRPNPGDKHVSPESTSGNEAVALAVDPDEPQDNLTPAQREQGEKCVLNMQAIEEAKTMWAVAHNKQAGETMTVADITTALPNSTMPLCPAGGTYQLNQVGVPVTCTIPGHSLLP